MTPKYLHGLLAGAAIVTLSSAPCFVMAQTGGSTSPTRAPSGYSTSGSTKGAPATGTKSPSASGTKGATYGPAQPRTPQGNGPLKGAAPVRRTAGEDPIREPAFDANPAAGGTASSGTGKAALGTKNNPVPVPLAPRQPDWYPLAPNVQTWVDEVLVAWEKTSEDIVTFKCNFKRWEYDPAFGPKDPKTPFTYGTGLIQYAKPDKGMFKVETLKKYVGVKKVGDNPWVPEIGEQWVCDGRSIFEFDVRNKLLRQTILPMEMQGKAIADGPLPFLFGAKVDTLKSRYWIRPAVNVPEGHEGEYWLEAIPRYTRDAANFQKVTIVLDEKDFLPKFLDVYAPNYNRRTNPAHTEYEFDKRETKLKSEKTRLDILTPFLENFRKQFFAPEVPAGWKKVTEDLNAIPAAQPAAKGTSPGTAARPPVAKANTKTK